MNKILKKIGWFFYDEEAKRILLHRRDHNTASSPEKWDCFGGKVEDNGETTYEAFLRELCEELGITIEKNNVNKLEFNINNGVVYYAPLSMKDTSKIRLGEGAGFSWFTLECALRLDITDEARKILKKFKLTNIGKKFINNK